MACCSGNLHDGEEVPACSDLQDVEANGFVEMKTVKRRAKLFKQNSWRARYCALADDRLYLYTDMAKRNDPEALVIDLRDTLKISVRSYVARQSTSETALAVGCVMTITDRFKKKHKLRFGTGEERQYWAGHLSKATGKTIPDFEEKKVKSVPASRSVHQTEPESGDHQSHEQHKEDEDIKIVPKKEISADEMAEKRRNADDYVKWLRRLDNMLECRQRKLCAEIQSNLPVRTQSVGSGLNTMVGSVPGESSGDLQSIGDKLTGSAIPESVIAEKLDDSSWETQDDRLLSSMGEMCLSAATANEPVPVIEDVVVEDVKHAMVDVSAIKPSEMKVITRSPVTLKRCKLVVARPQPPPVPPKPVMKWESPTNPRLAPMITKMHEIFAARKTNSAPAYQNLRSLLPATSGTMQFPAYRGGVANPHCHKLITPPRPKWFDTVSQLAANQSSPHLRFKCDRSMNPVWKALQEKNQDLSADKSM